MRRNGANRSGRLPDAAASGFRVVAFDGINQVGLAVSWNFGGWRETGSGFGAPTIVRRPLEFCTSVADAAGVWRRIPVHMAYNILLLDASRDWLTFER